MLMRSVGRIFRGRATPFQIIAASILGAMIGFVPGWSQGPGLLVALVLALILLNANLGIAALVAGVAKLLSLALTPVSFMVGRALLDGPTRPLFAWAINAPVLALFGFDHYVTTGGALLGILAGLAFGVGIVWLVMSFRRRMAGLEENSAAFKKYAGTWWAKTLAFLFVGGGHGKATYSQLLEKRFGNPIRPLGVVVVLLAFGLLWILQAFASGPIMTAALVRGLERANGATVDIDNAEVDFRAGRLTMTGLAMADPNDLATDIFRAVSLEADISGADLLRKRVGLDTLVVNEASSGATRRYPGRLVGPPPTPAPAPPAEPQEKTIEDYIQQAKVWKERLAQVREWLETVSGDAEDVPEAERETLRERLEREVREKGYRNVRADHLIEGAPTFLIRSLTAQGVTSEQLQGEILDVEGENISTQPGLVDGAARLQVRSRSGAIEADIVLDPGAETGAKAGLHVAYRGLPADVVGAALAVGGQAPIQGGTIDAELTGGWHRGRVGYIDLPLSVTLHDTTLSVPGVAGAGSAKVDRFTLPIGLRGPIDNPRIFVDDDLLADALVQAGAGKLVEKGREEAEKAIEKATGGALDKIGGSGGLGKLLGGEKKDDRKRKEKQPDEKAPDR